jgi:hypothetical protein
MEFNKNIPKINAGLFLFYIAILGNYTGNILPNSLIRFINKYRFFQYFISFLLLLFTVNIYNDTIPFIQVIGYSFLLWIWYILTIKQYLLPSISIIVLLLISYILFNFSNDLDKKISLQQEEDNVDKNILQRKKTYQKIQIICFYLIIVISCLGGVLYFLDKFKKYRKNDKSLLSFLFRYFFRGTGNKSIHKIMG